MNHPDDAFQAAEPKEIAILIGAAAPEKAQAWQDIVERYGITFHPIADRRGVTLRARGRRVEFDNKTMTWLWLLAFAGWRAFCLHGPHLLRCAMTGAVIDGQLRRDDPTYTEAEGDFEAVLYAVREFPALDSTDEHDSWPQRVPKPQADKQGMDHEQQAAFDLTMLATAYMLLHEVHHVMFNADGGRPSASDEELDCDAFARAFLLGGVSDYARSSGEQVEAVLAKRAAGIALGTYALYNFTPEMTRGGSSNYPPIADRLGALFPEVGLPRDHWFWNFAASLLVATIVGRDRAAVIPSLIGPDLCQTLLETLRTKHSA